MNRFSVLNPSVHFSHFSLSPADRLRLANTYTPGEEHIDIPPIPAAYHTNRTSVYATDFIADQYRGSTTSTLRRLQLDKAAGPAFQPNLRFYLAFSALAALSLVVALDGTSISVALPVITEKLDGSAIEAFWAGTSFLLASTVFQPVYASFSHLFGRKNLMLVAVKFFLVGTITAGVATNMMLMLVGRTLQGVGGSGIISLTNVLITDLIPLRHRGNWVGILGAMWAVGSVTGPVVGGSLAHPGTWRWIFYLNLPFITIAFFMVFFFIRLKGVQLRLVEKIKRADWGGATMFVGSMTAILIPLSWAGVQYDWSSWRVTVPLGFGVIGLILTGVFERFATKEPVIKTVVFRNRTTNIAYLNTALHGMCLWVLLYYQPLYFEGVRGYSPVISGVALFPATFTVAPLAIITGLSISKMGKFRFAVWGGWGCTLVGVAFLIAVDIDTQLTQVLLTDLIAGIGLGALFPALQTQLQAASDPKNLAAAVSMFSFFRGLGQTIGIAIGGNIFQNELANKLKAYPEFADRADELAKDATSLVAWMKDAPPGDPRTHMRTAYTESIRTVYIMAAVVALIATIASFWTQHYDLDQELQTEHVLEDVDAVDAVDDLVMKDAERGHWEKGKLVKETSAKLDDERLGGHRPQLSSDSKVGDMQFAGHRSQLSGDRRERPKLEGSKLRRQLSVR